MTKKIAVSLNLDRSLMRYTLIYQGIQDYAEQHTDWSIFWDHYPETKLNKCSENGEKVYDAVIGRIKKNTYKETQRLGIPCVNLWYNSLLQKEIPSSLIDFREVGKLTARHLINRGFKKITVIDFKDTSSLHFVEGIKSVLKPLGYTHKFLRYNRVSTESAKGWEKQQDAFEEWFKNWTYPMAIASSMPLITIPTFCKSKGLKIPEDVAIVMAGAESGICETIKPLITTIDTNYHQTGYEAARLLHRIFKDEDQQIEHVYTKPKGVIARQSTDTYATEDEIVKKALRFIADNIDKEIQVLDVVHEVCLSKSTLEKRFKASTGTTIKEEINRLRLICAQRILTDKNVRIKDVHRRSGFSSALHMRRVFQKNLGMSPGEYRKKQN